MKYIDITQSISTGMKKYPSDPEVKVSTFKSLKKGNSCNLSELVLGSHSGTHIDAPYHIFNKAKTIDKVKVDSLICNVSVRDMIRSPKKIFFNMIKSKKVKGILFRSGKIKAKLTLEKAQMLVKQNIKLVGTDQMNIEESVDKSHPVHRLLLGKGVIIVEGLNLKKVKLGYYRLICLPLKIKDGDGSPARAILAEGVV